MSDAADVDRVRTAREIATRALALFGIMGLGLSAPRDEVIDWLKDNGLWHALTPWELRFAEAPAPTERMMINASWRSEALFMLLWALEKIDGLPPANEQCSTALLQDILPPNVEITLPPNVEITEAQFIETATRRSDEVLRAQAELCLDLHAEYYAAERDGKPPSWPVDIEIIQERHHAINWVIG